MSLPAGNSTVHPHSAAAWRARADDLAAWAWRRLVNRRDVWGRYYLDAEGHARQWTAPRKQDRGRFRLTPDTLRDHFSATHTEQVVGLHTTAPDNTCRSGAA